MKSERMRSACKKIIPRRWVRALRLFRAEATLQRLLDSTVAEKDGVWLNETRFEELMSRYGYPEPYGYDSESLLKRGEERAEDIRKRLCCTTGQTAVEVGCGDGMVSRSLQIRGMKSIAVDQSAHWFDQRAIDDGVDFRIAAGEELPLETCSADFAFSYNAFEHIGDPGAAVRDMLRVIRPGGAVDLSFGPLYNSAFGEHAYRSVPVPYCQFLFSLGQMNSYCRNHQLDEIDAHHVNRWSLWQFRELWEDLQGVAKTDWYYEGGSLSHIDLIKRFPGFFKRASSRSREFLVSEIQIILRKK